MRQHYVLQEEFVGDHIRLNLVGERLYTFPLDPKKKIKTKSNLIKKFDIKTKLTSLCNENGLNNWLVKFDLVMNNQDYVLLDIGIDPPMRMLKLCEEMNFPFYESYINLVLGETYLEFPGSEV